MVSSITVSWCLFREHPWDIGYEVLLCVVLAQLYTQSISIAQVILVEQQSMPPQFHIDHQILRSMGVSFIFFI